MSGSRGTALSRAVNFFREGNYDEARVAFTLVKEVMDARAASVKSQAKATERGGTRKSRKLRGETATTTHTSVAPPPGSQERVAAGG